MAAPVAWDPGPPDQERLVAAGQFLLGMPDEARSVLLHRQDGLGLDAAERAMAAAKGIGWRGSPAAMARHLTGGEFQVWRYVDFLSRKFVDAVEGRSSRQIWNLPSRMGKTSLAKWGTVWVLDRTEGRANIIVVSYGYELAARTSTDVRDILVAHEDVLRGQLRPDRRRHDRFVTVAGGGVLAAGIDGAITGFGAGNGGGIIVDDPFKNWQQAHSEARRDYVSNQFKGTIRNRLDQEAAWIIVIHHRVHEDDLTARLLADAAADDGDQWEHVSLPALAVENDALGRQPGEPLEPLRFSRDDCLARARGLGSYLAASLEQQNPTSEEGTELLRRWFVLAEASEMPTFPERANTSWDLKLKDRDAGDYVVGQCWWAVGPGRWCVEQIRGQYDHATTQNAIALLAVRHPEAHEHVVEAAGSADEVVPALRRPEAGYTISDEMAGRLGMTVDERAAVETLRRAGMGGLTLEPATGGSKSVRARTHIAPTAEAGNVRLPADAPWTAALLDEVASFPNGTHDDQVDAMSQALKRLSWTAPPASSIETLRGARLVLR